MSINKRCPSCNALMPTVEASKTMPLAGAAVLWRSCNNCGYKWREAYNFVPMSMNVPWTKPPQDGEESDDEEEQLT